MKIPSAEKKGPFSATNLKLNETFKSRLHTHNPKAQINH